MTCTIVEVKTRRDLKRFISFPDLLYRDCPQYVPALHSDQVKSLTGISTLSYCTRRMWLAIDAGSQVVGRICAMINPRYNDLYHLKRARFGWFDTIDDMEVARLLIDTATEWAARQGMTEIHGPLYYNTLGKQGMLVEGFDHLPPFNCIYNYPYYSRLLESLGFEKEFDWLQYRIDVTAPVPEKVERVAALVREKYALKEADIDALKKDKDRLKQFFAVYNESFSSSVTNFIPFTEEETEEEMKSTIPFISGKTSTVLVDPEGGIAAFGIAFPSISMALRKARGHIFPFGWIYLLKTMRDCSTVDLMVNGASLKWRNKGVSSLYHSLMSAKARRNGTVWAVTNPQIESNDAVNIWQSYTHEPWMRRRCYIKKIEK